MRSRRSNNMFDDYKEYKKQGGWGIGQILLTSIAAIIVISLLGWGLSWILTPLRVTSVQHVEHEWDFAYTRIEALKSTAVMVCDAEKAYNNATDENTRTQRQTQLIALENNYNRQVAEYNQEMDNAFKAGLVKPADVPRDAPTLIQM